MPATTGEKYPTAHEITPGLGADWSFPGNVYTASEPEDGSYTHVTLSSTALAHDPIMYYAYALLTENNGPIPDDPDLVIVSVTADFRLSVFNSTNAVDNIVGSLSGTVMRGSTVYASTTAVTAPARQNSGIVTRSISWPGTVNAPQTTFSRADLLSTGANRLQCRLNASVASGVTGNTNLRCHWIRFIVEYAIVRVRAGGAAALGAGGATQRAVVVARIGGGIRPASAGGERKAVTARLGGGIGPRAAGGARKTELAKAGGGLRPATGGGPGKPAVAKAGGALGLLSGGGPRKAESSRFGGGIAVGASGADRKAIVVKGGGGGVGNPQGGGVRKTGAVKAGGAGALLLGGGLGRVTKDTAGGALLIARGGGPKLLAVARAGGGALPRVGGGARVTGIVKNGGGLLIARGGGPGKPAVAKAGGGLALLLAGGTRVVQVDRAGGAVALLLAGGSRTVQADRAGGGVGVPRGGGSKLLVVARAGGAVLVGVGGGEQRSLIDKAGGALALLFGGGVSAADVAKAGGGALPGVGGLLQYSVYTFGIGGFSRDGTGAIVPASKMALFALRDGGDSYEFKGMTTSDPVTGRFAFITSSPTSDPTTYWVSMHRVRDAGGNLSGRTDEDLVPEATLVQGQEV